MVGSLLWETSRGGHLLSSSSTILRKPSSFLRKSKAGSFSSSGTSLNPFTTAARSQVAGISLGRILQAGDLLDDDAPSARLGLRQLGRKSAAEWRESRAVSSKGLAPFLTVRDGSEIISATELTARVSTRVRACRSAEYQKCRPRRRPTIQNQRMFLAICGNLFSF